MPTMKRLSRNEYTVGWVCPLEVEMSAARYLLDEEHERLPREPGDPNYYVFGQIKGHNIVIGSLPAGQQGISPSAAIATHMTRSFPSITLRLLVGIGGGIPGKADVRLGDVVVSIPNGTSGGVIEYDFGKQSSTGFERKGFLCPPPKEWLAVLPGIMSDHRTRPNKVSTYISAMLARHPKLVAYKRPSMQKDILYLADNLHAKGYDTCSNCDGKKVVPRPAREQSDESVVHYGLIASGNKVMKDAIERDRIAEHSGGALCFEMEAAGLMNDFPCIVIRGISDYADTHKNDNWHAYAAVAAAAFAKELLSYIDPVNTTKSVVPTRTEEPKASRKACWTVPFQRNLKFSGRTSELAKLDELLSSEDGCERVAITGLGGVGKTQIVVEFAYKLREEHPDLSVFWVTMINAETVQQAYLEIGRKLRIPNLHENQANIRKLLQDYLSHESSGQWVLIFDNADSIELCEQTGLIDFLPTSRHGSILFTTRSRKIAVKLAGNKVIRVGEMDETVARQILSRSLIDQDLLRDEKATSDLLESLTFLPLAIVQAAAYINENENSISDYLALINGKEQDVVEVLSQDFEDEGRYKNNKNPIASTWLISFEQIKTREPLAVELLSFMSCLEPKDIPLSILPTNQSVVDTNNAIGTLTAYSFVSKRPESKSLDLHRLVHLATRNWLKEEGLLVTRTRSTTTWLSQIFPNNDHKNRTLWRTYLPHARYVIECSNINDGGEDVLTLLGKYADCLYNDGRFNEAEISYKQELEVCSRVLGVEHPHTLRSMNDLGLIYWKKGRFEEAQKLQAQVLEARKRVLGAEHPYTLLSTNNLSLTYWNQGLYGEAEKLQLSVLEARKRLIGAEHPDTLLSMSNLASTYTHQGRYNEGRDLQEQALEARRRLLGVEHPDTLFSMSNLASTYTYLGLYDEAEDLEETVLERRRRVLGPDHPDTMVSMNNLALIYWRQTRYDDAEELQVPVLKARRKLLGPEHRETLVAMHNLALTYWKNGHEDEALELMEECVRERKRKLGSNHQDTVNSRAWLDKFQESGRKPPQKAAGGKWSMIFNKKS